MGQRRPTLNQNVRKEREALAHALSRGFTHSDGALVLPKNAHAYRPASAACSPCPRPPQLSEVQPQWFPTHVAHWPNIEMIQSAVGEQAGCPESS